MNLIDMTEEIREVFPLLPYSDFMVMFEPSDEKVKKFHESFPETMLVLFYANSEPVDIPKSTWIAAFKFSEGSGRNVINEVINRYISSMVEL